jgi:cytochrome P450
MAVMQMLSAIVAIVRRYDFALEPDREINMRAMMILRPDGPIKMKFTRAAGAF